MLERTRKYNRWALSLRKSRVGKQCENWSCMQIIDDYREAQVNHLMRRTHAPDLMCERENVRVACKGHGSPEDFVNGVHTSNVERVRIVYNIYGKVAAWYLYEKLCERRFLDGQEKEILAGVLF